MISLETLRESSGRMRIFVVINCCNCRLGRMFLSYCSTHTHTHIQTAIHRTHTVTRLDNISNRLISQETKNYNRKINTETETDRMRKPN